MSAARYYRVGSGEPRRIPDTGLDCDAWHALRTLTGVEWYDASGALCVPPGPLETPPPTGHDRTQSASW